MTDSVTTVEELKKVAALWHKILQIRKDGDRTIVSVVQGIANQRDSAAVLTADYPMNSSQEIDKFLSGPEMRAKMFSPVERGIVLVDIAGYSQFDTLGQGAILAAFHESLRLGDRSMGMFSANEIVDLIVPTGDGCFLILNPEYNEKALLSVFSLHSSFHCHQARLMKQFDVQGDSVGLRFACNVGEVDFIVDSGGNRNAYGTGVNETARLLEMGRKGYREKHDGADPTGIVYFGDRQRSQAELLSPFLTKVADTYEVDLGKIKGKHDLELNLSCFAPLPDRIGFALDVPLPTMDLQPVFLQG